MPSPLCPEAHLCSVPALVDSQAPVLLLLLLLLLVLLLVLLQVLSSPTDEVERHSLMSQLPSAWDVLRNLGTVITLQEPTYTQVVVLYRNAVKPRVKQQAIDTYDDDDDDYLPNDGGGGSGVKWQVGGYAG